MIRTLIVIYCCAVATVAALGLLVTAGLTDGPDQAISDWFRTAEGRPIGSATVIEYGRDVTAMGSAVAISLATAAGAAWLALQRRWHNLMVLSVVLVAAAVISVSLKDSIERARPQASHWLALSDYSFPSGHSLFSMAIYPTLALALATSKRSRRYLVGCGLACAVLVGVSRVYLGAHFPSDVLAGWSIGLGIAILAGLILDEPPRPAGESYFDGI